MILGISASGREDRVTEHAGRSVSGCRACLGCARDSFCRYEDDWLEIGRAMLEADAMVFGAPAYYGTMNAHEQGSLMPLVAAPDSLEYTSISSATVGCRSTAFYSSVYGSPVYIYVASRLMTSFISPSYSPASESPRSTTSLPGAAECPFAAALLADHRRLENLK